MSIQKWREAAELSAMDYQRLRQFLRARSVDWDNDFYRYRQAYLDELLAGEQQR